MNSLDTYLQLIKRVHVDDDKFVDIAKQIRSSFVITDAFPGEIGELDISKQRFIGDILSKYANIVFNNINKFDIRNIMYGIDSLCKSSLCFICRYLKTDDSNDFMESLSCMQNVSLFYANNVKRDYHKYCGCYIFNIASILYKKEKYDEALQCINILIKINNTLRDKINIKKCYKLKALTLIARGKSSYDEFIEAIENSTDQESIFLTWINVITPKDTNIVYSVLKILNSKTITEKSMPYFALNGDFRVLSSFQAFENFFPKFEPPKKEVYYDISPHAIEYFLKIYKLYTERDFARCFQKSEKFLTKFAKKQESLNNYLCVFYIHVWLINSLFAVGRPDAALFYSKRMYHVFKKFPFSVGLASFYILKGCIHLNDYSFYKEPPKFNGTITWECVNYFKLALENSEYSEVVFHYYQKILECNNMLVKRDIFHYFCMTSRYHNVRVPLEEFEEICKTSNDSYALFAYHTVVEKLRSYEIDEFWDFRRPKKAPIEFFKLLQKAEKCASNNAPILRKIRQLQALISGTNNPSETALLITTSVSSSLDLFIKSQCHEFRIPFPFLSIVYPNVYGLDQCLLLAFYHPSSHEFVVRIKTGNKIESILEELESIKERSGKITTDIEKSEWWKSKRELDLQLQSLLERIECDILGKWAGVLTPQKYSKKLSSFESVLTTYIRSLKTEGERIHFREQFRREFNSDLNENNPPVSNLPIALILGKYVNKIPWESLPCVTANKTTMTRLPSFKLIANQSYNKLPLRRFTNNAYYFIEANTDLENTKNRMYPIFKKFKWDGYHHESGHPDETEFIKALQKRDLFVFCGHGCGEQFFRYSKLIDNGKVNCHSSLILMGCSSGALNDGGELDPIGAPYYCLAAGSPAVVGTLWDVTDGDIDRFFIQFLNLAKDERGISVNNAVAKSRSACKLNYLTGASIVVYGFPTVLE